MTQRTIAPSLRFRNLGIDAGLPNDMASSIVQDRQGYIWIGTSDGLASYDGYEFTVLRDKLPDLTITTMVADPASGDLWLGTTKGLARVNPRTREVSRYSLAKKGASAADAGVEPAVLAIAVAEDGIVWVGTNGDGLIRLDPKTSAHELFRQAESGAKHISFDTVTALLAEKDKLWVGTGGAGIDVISMSQHAVIRHVASTSDAIAGDADAGLVQVIHRAANGTLWIGTGSGIARLDEATGKTTFSVFSSEAASPSNDVNAILDGDGDTLWVATNRGLFHFDAKQNTSTSYVPDRGDPESIPSEVVTSLMRDREGMIWVGTFYNGVGCFHPLSQYFTYYNFGIHSYLEDHSGHMWVGTASELCRAEGLHTLTGALSCYAVGSMVRSLYEDNTGIIWGATMASGMFRFDPNTAALHFYVPSDAAGSGPSSATITSIYGVRDGLWIPTFGGGLDYFDKATGNFRVFAHDPSNKTSISSDNLHALVPTRHGGDFWLATTEGVDRFDPRTGRVTAVYKQSAKRSDNADVATSVYETEDGILWVGTYGAGIERIDPAHNELQLFPDTEERGRNNVFSVVPDEQGFLWLSTNAGISRFDPKQHTFERFYPSDGLQGLAYIATTTYKDSMGRIYFGGVNGTNVFRPSDIHRTKQKAPLVLRRLQIDGKDVDIGNDLQKGLSLAYNNKVVGLDFSVLSYIDPEASHYKYRIEGLHDWVDLGSRHFITVNTLPSGNYTMQITGKSRTGAWDEEGVRIAVRVAPPPWRTWWAYAIYAAVLVAIVGLFLLRQRAQLDALRDAHRLSELEREIALTSAIQVGCLPLESTVRDGRFSLEGFHRPATECGGDWWAYEQRGDWYLVVVADATGHGAGSAMVTAATVACFRSLTEIVDDNARMEAMNREVLRVSQQQYHMTLTAMDLNVKTGEFVVMSAGGVPAFLMPPQGRPRVLMCPGTPLGSLQFELGRVNGRLEPGERVLLVTDGLPEVALANAQLLGPRGMANFFMQTRTMPLEDALPQLVGKVEEVQIGAQDDDWTAVMIQWNPNRG